MSTHFTDAELACRCGCGLLPSANFIEALEGLRTVYASAMHISSCARCPAHNEAVSTTGPEGPHIPRGDFAAVDVLVTGRDMWHLIHAAFKHGGWFGVGISKRGDPSTHFVHLDNHWNGNGLPRPRVWTY